MITFNKRIGKDVIWSTCDRMMVGLISIGSWIAVCSVSVIACQEAQHDKKDIPANW
jgi:hypothetical protein